MSIAARIVRKARRTAKVAVRKREARRRGIAFLAPNYIFFDRFGPSSVVFDVGCGHVAELSRHLIASSGCRAFGVDPTRKHAPALQAIERATAGRFTHLPYAVAATAGPLTFHESVENESGSLLTSHTNIVRDHVRPYEVEAVTLGGLLDGAGVDGADLLKLDLEGAEYELVRGLGAGDLEPFGQVFIEFHHHSIPDRSEEDTARAVEHLCRQGLQSFSLDDHNVLFFW